MNTATTPSSFKLPRHTWLVAGGLALAGAGLAAGLALKQPESQVALEDSLATYESVPESRVAAKPAAKPAPKRVVVACADCGVVESVSAIQQKGEGSGAGAVVGGVLGGVVGNQMGGGNGKKAMTVIGAIGGGLAGNEVEKHARSSTVYDVKVRMDDGTLRSMTLAQAPGAGKGDRVTVRDGYLQRLAEPRHAT